MPIVLFHPIDPTLPGKSPIREAREPRTPALAVGLGFHFEKMVRASHSGSRRCKRLSEVWAKVEEDVGGAAEGG